jgi:fumarate hydratase class II
MIANLIQSITLLSDGCMNFRKFLIEGTRPNRKKIGEYVSRSLMLVTALAPVIGYDKASKIPHHALGPRAKSRGLPRDDRRPSSARSCFNAPKTLLFQASR